MPTLRPGALVRVVVSRPKLLELASCEYLVRGEDVVLAGPIGTGKTMLAIALGVEAARRRKRVAFIRAADLVRDLREARDERTLGLVWCPRSSHANSARLDSPGCVLLLRESACSWPFGLGTWIGGPRRPALT